MSIWLCFSEVRALIECKDRASHVCISQTKSSRGSGDHVELCLVSRSTGDWRYGKHRLICCIVNIESVLFQLACVLFQEQEIKPSLATSPSRPVCAHKREPAHATHTALYGFRFSCVVTSIFSLSLGFLCQRGAILLVTLTDIELGFRQRHKVFISPLILKGATVRKHTVPLSLT